VRRGSSVSILTRSRDKEILGHDVETKYVGAQCLWVLRMEIAVCHSIGAPGISMWLLDFRSVDEPLDQATRLVTEERRLH